MINELVTTQERYLREVVETIESIPSARQRDLESLWQSIQKIKEDLQTASDFDYAALSYQLNQQESLYKQMAKGDTLPDLSSPYFAYMKFKESSGPEREVFLGNCGCLLSGRNYKIIDWKNAPLAQIFYNYSEGEEFEIDLPGRTLEGVLIDKVILTIEKGVLLRIDAHGDCFLKQNGEWIQKRQLEVELKGGEGTALSVNTFGTGMSEFSSPQVISMLDKHQFQVVNNCSRDPLLVVGGAGSGKTTVALHRIATLCKRHIVPPNSIMVIVPHVGLVELSRKLLAEIGLTQVLVSTNDEWFSQVIYRMFPELSKRISYTTPLSVSMLKRHASVMTLIDAMIEKQRAKVLGVIESLEGKDGDIAQYFASLRHLPLIRQLEKLYEYEGLTTIHKIEIKKVWLEMNDVELDRQSLFYSEYLLNDLKELSGGVITERMIKDTVRHTGYQMQEPEYQNDEKVALDGKEDTDGSVYEYYGTIDPDDFPILMYLQLKKYGSLETAFGSVRRVHHLVLDEAQELSPIEQIIFGHVVHNFGSITIAGDAAQQIDPTISFTGWRDMLARMGLDSKNIAELDVSYRSPEPIINFAHDVLGPLAPAQRPKSSKKGVPVMVTTAQHIARASLDMYEQLGKLLLNEPKATVCVICNQIKTARALYSELKELGHTRLVEHSDFSFRPGIDVTTVDQIRGLEFDYVIVPDCDQENYPLSNVARKRLHLAVTRAIYELWVIAPGVSSPLLPQK